MKLTLPLTLTLPRKTKTDKVFALNLNIYRNAHHHVLDDAKKIYARMVSDELFYYRNLPGNQMPSPPYLFRYTVFPGNARKFDLANILPIVQKFADDALIALGVITDDNYTVIRAINYRIGEIDRTCPRVELEILQWVEDEEKKWIG